MYVSVDGCVSVGGFVSVGVCGCVCVHARVCVCTSWYMYTRVFIIYVHICVFIFQRVLKQIVQNTADKEESRYKTKVCIYVRMYIYACTTHGPYTMCTRTYV